MGISPCIDYLASMKTELCTFSGFKIHPGRGIRFVRGDSKTFVFLNPKSRVAFQRKGNPRRCLWTAIYRRLHHKGSANKEMKKKKARKTKRVERAIAGTTLDELKKKRTETPEQRAAARKAAKENKVKKVKAVKKK